MNTMTEHVIPMVVADANRRTYGIEHVSRYVYRINGARHNPYAPHRLQAWSNLRRPNPHPGEVRWGQHGPIGGDGRYLDPHNRATDSPHSLLFSAEATVITNNGTNTGTEASGQVYATEDLAIGDTVILRYPDGTLSDSFQVTAKPLSDPILTAL
jgi:hypothetical protein